jgi:hypothetical protein
MIEMVTKEKFYKDSRHDPLCPTVPKDPRASRAGSSAALAAAPSCTTHSRIFGSELVQNCSTSHICDVSTHGSVLGCHGAAPTDCEVQPGDYSQPAG